MSAGQVNRTLLTSFYQNASDVYDDNKTEGAFGVLANQIDDNWSDYATAINAGTLSKLGITNVKDNKVSGSPLTTTGSIVVGTTSLTLNAIIDFANGQGISIPGAGVAGAKLITTIVSGAGSLNLVLAAAASTTVSGATVSHDDTAALQTVLDNVGVAGGGIIIAPPGTYQTTSPLVLNYDNVHFIGAGIAVSKINFTGIGYAIKTSGASSREYCQIEGFSITVTATGHGMSLKKAYQCIVARNKITGTGTASQIGIDFYSTSTGTYYNEVAENYFYNLDICFNLDSDLSVNSPNRNNFYRNTIEGCKLPIYINRGGTNMFVSNKIGNWVTAMVQLGTDGAYNTFISNKGESIYPATNTKLITHANSSANMFINNTWTINSSPSDTFVDTGKNDFVSDYISSTGDTSAYTRFREFMGDTILKGLNGTYSVRLRTDSFASGVDSFLWIESQGSGAGDHTLYLNYNSPNPTRIGSGTGNTFLGGGTGNIFFNSYFRIYAPASLPVASVTYRGMRARIEGAAGVADVTYECMKSAADTYSWKIIATG